MLISVSVGAKVFICVCGVEAESCVRLVRCAQSQYEDQALLTIAQPQSLHKLSLQSMTS